ncbi:MAG: hypothetical protein OEL20_19790 [Sulfuritalea sp.]|nr:hypothetical protein [Sulfuritalea sp.]
MKRPSLQPMVQGELDSLCGLYSVVNAIRWALGANPPRLTAEDVFAIVVSQVERVADAGAALTEGIEPPHLYRALTHTLDVLRDHHGIDLIADLPFVRQRKATIEDVRAALTADLRESGTAYLVVFWGRLDHWSVVRGVTSASFMLFDSAGFSRVPLDHCRLRGEARGDRSRLHVLDRRGIIRLRLREKTMEVCVGNGSAGVVTDAEVGG